MLMKALSVRQPFASAIMLGEKPIEYRSWATRYRGTLLIHSSIKAPHLDDVALFPLQRKQMPLGVILGTVGLFDVQGSKGDFEWLLRNPRPFRWPIPHKGQVGLWTARLTCNCDDCHALQEFDLGASSRVCVRCGKRFMLDLFAA